MVTTNPFAVAHAYLTLGWHPLPLPARRKVFPPAGYTGTSGAVSSAADVQAWLENGYGGVTRDGNTYRVQPDGMNIAIRYPRTVVGLDEDNPAAFTRMVDAVGPLPDTWRIRSGGATSGDHHLYRLPRDVQSERFGGSLIVPDTGEIAGELLRWKHRYSVAPPSIHPDTGRAYTWIDPNGEPTVEAPSPSDLAELPWAWVKHLTPKPRGNLAHLFDRPIANPDAYVAACLEAVRRQPTGGRHDHLKSVCTRLALKGILADHAESVIAAAAANGKARSEAESIITWCLDTITAGDRS